MARDKKSRKNLAMRVLDAAGASYEVISFPDSIHDAVGVAEYAGVPAANVYKTLVVQAEEPGQKPMLVMIGADRELDPKKLAQAVDVKKAHMARQADAERLTHLKVGGISALALLNKGFRVLLDSRAETLEFIVVSAGERGLNLRLSVADLISATDATLVEASREK